MPSSRQTSTTTIPFSAYLMAKAICSGVYRDLLMVCSPLFRIPRDLQSNWTRFWGADHGVNSDIEIGASKAPLPCSGTMFVHVGGSVECLYSFFCLTSLHF